jgi:ribosomal protein S18 acetylase RimI-like enzyme
MVNHVDGRSGDSLGAMAIRDARPEEHDEIGRVTADAYHGYVRDETYLARIANVGDRAPRTQVLVATDDDGAIVGSLTLELNTRVNADDDPLEAHRAHIRMLGVAPAAQGHGIGRRLMNEAEARARNAGKTEMTLHTTEAMIAAQRMYEALGYERMEDEILPDGFVLLGYRKELGAPSV